MNIQPILDFINSNKDSSTFYKSLSDQYEARGFLTQKQKDCVVQALEKEEQKNKLKAQKEKFAQEQEAEYHAQIKNYSIKQNDILEIRTWLAKSFQEALKMDFFFRNLEVVAVLDETPKAYCVKVKFSSQILASCHVCGLALSNPVSKATGLGPTCARRIGLSRPTVAHAEKTLAELEAFCTNVGVIGEIWIPKSQIKSITRK